MGPAGQHESGSSGLRASPEDEGMYVCLDMGVPTEGQCGFHTEARVAVYNRRGRCEGESKCLGQKKNQKGEILSLRLCRCRLAGPGWKSHLEGSRGRISTSPLGVHGTLQSVPSPLRPSPLLPCYAVELPACVLSAVLGDRSVRGCRSCYASGEELTCNARACVSVWSSSGVGILSPEASLLKTTFTSHPLRRAVCRPRGFRSERFPIRHEGSY